MILDSKTTAMFSCIDFINILQRFLLRSLVAVESFSLFSLFAFPPTLL